MTTLQKESRTIESKGQQATTDPPPPGLRARVLHSASGIPQAAVESWVASSDGSKLRSFPLLVVELLREQPLAHRFPICADLHILPRLLSRWRKDLLA